MRMIRALTVLLAATAPVAAARAQEVVMRRPLPAIAVRPAVMGTWSSSSWVTQGQACGLMRQTRTATCSADVCAPEDRPVEEQEIGGPQCVLAWVPGDQGDWSSTCSDAATRTLGTTCISHPPGAPQDAQGVADSVCIAGGLAKPASSETQGVYSGCTNTWKTGEWSDVCGPTAVSTRAVTCVRSGGDLTPLPVDDGLCDASTRPPSSDDSSTADTYKVCISDASFEAGGAGWSDSRDAGVTPIAHTGAQGLLLSGYSSLKQISFPSVPGETLMASVWHRAAVGSHMDPFIALGPTTARMFEGGAYNFGNAGPSWTNLTMEWRPTTTTTYLSLSIVNSATPDNKVAMDDVVVIARRR